MPHQSEVDLLDQFLFEDSLFLYPFLGKGQQDPLVQLCFQVSDRQRPPDCKTPLFSLLQHAPHPPEELKVRKISTSFSDCILFPWGCFI